MPDIEIPEYIEDSLHLPCPSCGSHLHYSAAEHKIVCDYCGYQEDIDHSNDKVVEQSLAEAAAKMEDYIPEERGQKVFDCQNCGAKFIVESDRPTVNCGFCGSRNVNLEAYKHQYIQPVGIIPFYVSREEAEKKFKHWVGRGWFHPSKLKRLAHPDTFHGIYIPFWTYDAQTESDWRGDAGYYYYEEHQVMRNGKMETQRVQKVRWQHRSGHLSHFFDDLLVVASGGIDKKLLRKIMPYRLEELVNFDPKLTVGWESEIYELEVDQGYTEADQQMDARIRQMCSAQLGGDTQRNLRISSHKSNQTFKHIILPIWICTYAYGNKQYHFLINGQSGKVNGQKPLSWVKILILVLLIAALIALIIVYNR